MEAVDSPIRAIRGVAFFDWGLQFGEIPDRSRQNLSIQSTSH